MAEQMQQYNVRLPRALRDFIQNQPEPANAVRKVLLAWHAREHSVSPMADDNLAMSVSPHGQV